MNYDELTSILIKIFDREPTPEEHLKLVSDLFECPTCGIVTKHLYEGKEKSIKNAIPRLCNHIFKCTLCGNQRVLSYELGKKDYLVFNKNTPKTLDKHTLFVNRMKQHIRIKMNMALLTPMAPKYKNSPEIAKIIQIQIANDLRDMVKAIDDSEITDYYTESVSKLKNTLNKMSSEKKK